MPKSSDASGEMRPSESLATAVHRRALSVSEELASRGLGAFVWRKKLDRDLARGLLPDITSLRAERRRCLARQREAGRIKKTPAASPPPASLRRKEEEGQQDSDLLLVQSRRKAAIRVALGEPKPIDLLLKSLDSAQPGALAAFRGTSAKDLEELRGEIARHADLDREHKQFWEAAKVTCDAEIQKALGAMVSDSAAAEYSEAKNYLEHHNSCRNVDKEQQCVTERGDGVVADAGEGWEALLPVESGEDSAEPGWRKPSYTARVHSGRVWNQYNRTHYDRDHPPPATVKGYRFVVYYPDLGGNVTPQYAIEHDGASSDTCLIRFHAGWPYEDIAFRIVNTEWELSPKTGFRCTFDKGVLHLNVHFKRFSYRR